MLPQESRLKSPPASRSCLQSSSATSSSSQSTNRLTPDSTAAIPSACDGTYLGRSAMSAEAGGKQPLVSPRSGARCLSVEKQLRRARASDVDAPLSVCFDSRSMPDIPKPLLDLVLPTSQRWVGLQLRNAQLELCDDDWVASLAGKLPRLERLEIFDCANWLPPEGVFTTAPRLTRALTTSADTGEVSPPVELPWAQLTHYRGALEPAEHIPHLFLAADTLVECVLGRAGMLDVILQDDIDPERIPTPILLPRLRRLHLTSADLLDYITTPALEGLYLWSELWGIDDPDYWALVPFLQRSGCTLRSLALFNCDFGPTFTAELFNAVPLLEELLFEGTRVESGERMFAALSHSDDVSLLLPSLRELVYGYPNGTEPTETVFAAVKARVPTMRRFLLYEAEGWRVPEGDSRIRELKEMGVDAQWVSSDHPVVQRKHWGDF
ncbi:F-box domain-containing protein [Mycena kentingensis (nom. inval.)]|nr:F-box domain-containing protein [Mycena kentingensis (nom. inval.)]